MTCLTTNEVVGFLNGHLSEQQVEAVEQHLDDCPACRFLVAELARVEAGEPPPLEALAGEPDSADTLPSAISVDAIPGAGPRPKHAPVEDIRSKVPAEAEGRYQIRSEYRRGGQARILVAFDTYMGREVAFKELIRDDEDEGRDPPSKRQRLRTRRFLREARIAGRLTHPSIVHVYETGRRVDGNFYYTMPLVRGKTLAEELASCNGLNGRLLMLGHFLNLCHGIAYAHSQGVLHRDIKPENVIVGEFGETVLLDWGLAKTVARPEGADSRELPEEEEVLTELGMSLGTPAYMSPEQAAGEVDKVDERSDVWGLGAVLYTLLTGTPPFRGKSAASIVVRVMTTTLPPVHLRSSGAPPALAAVADKALSRDPNRRYQSVKALAEDITAYMTGGRVGAHEYTSWERVRTFAARHKVALVLAFATVAMVLSALVFLTLAYHRGSRALRAEQQARVQEREARQATSQKASGPRRRVPPSATAQTEGAIAVARSADGTRVATARRDGAIQLWDAHTGFSLKVLRVHLGAVTAVAFSPDGKRLASAGSDHQVIVWRSGSGSVELTVKAPRITALAFSSDGELLVASSRDGTAHVWRLADGKATRVKDAANQKRREK
ncbi:MAG: protein kinase [bacterium]